MRPKFWTLPLAELSSEEWEALCDGCGLCCLNKLEDEDTGTLVYTRIACRLFDPSTCRCRDYENRRHHVPECVVLSLATLREAVRWLPASCAYKRRFLGQDLPRWHPLLSRDPESVHRRRNSIRGRTISETDVVEADWENHLLKVVV